MATPQKTPEKTEALQKTEEELHEALRRYLEKPSNCIPYHESMRRIDRRLEERSRK